MLDLWYLSSLVSSRETSVTEAGEAEVLPNGSIRVRRPPKRVGEGPRPRMVQPEEEDVGVLLDQLHKPPEQPPVHEDVEEGLPS